MFTIDFTSRVPIYEQICNNVIRLASAGVCSNRVTDCRLYERLQKKSE